jgi:UDP-N-acetyl-D-mannosaminuronic acid dehydrogenase
VTSVCVHGLGYIGLPTAAMLAEAGHDVVGCDTSAEVVALVNAGRAAFRETDLDALLTRAWQGGRLVAQGVPAPATFHVIAVPTPFAEGHRPDLGCVERAADALAPVLRAGDVVILESTVPVGTTEALAARLAAARPDLRVPIHGAAAPEGAVHVAHCPERVMPGRTLHELVHNDRVIGGLTPDCAARAAVLYRDFVHGALVLADCRMAELVKLAENAFRDVNIAFANELARVCEVVGVDAWQAIGMANRHPRVNILTPGAGVGGHCIAVDPWFLVAGAPEETPLIRTAREVNDAVPRRIAARVREAASRFAAPRVACLGLAYKADVGDVRESPALAIAEEVSREGMRVMVCDPHLATLPAALARRPNVTLCDAASAIAEADIVVVLVAHRPFAALDRAAFEGKVVIDVVGLLRG